MSDGLTLALRGMVRARGPWFLRYRERPARRSSAIAGRQPTRASGSWKDRERIVVVELVVLRHQMGEVRVGADLQRAVEMLRPDDRLVAAGRDIHPDRGRDRRSGQRGRARVDPGDEGLE